MDLQRALFLVLAKRHDIVGKRSVPGVGPLPVGGQLRRPLRPQLRKSIFERLERRENPRRKERMAHQFHVTIREKDGALMPKVVNASKSCRRQNGVSATVEDSPRYDGIALQRWLVCVPVELP